jgi:hypothetical protein
MYVVFRELKILVEQKYNKLNSQNKYVESPEMKALICAML